jgi:uncharacterized protein (TIGR00369 family)
MLDPRENGWEIEVSADEFVALVGPLWSRTRDGEKDYAFVADRKHLSRFQRVHGGMLMWLADKALAMKASEAAGQPEQIATIQIDVQFVAPVKEGALVESRCEVVRKTGSLVFVTGRLLAAGQTLVSASGVWKYR